MSQALYRKWRPKSWQDVLGQEHVTQTLRNAIQSERLVHAYLFAGPRGTGKTSMARLLAKAVNCLDPDPAHRPCNHCPLCEAVNQGRFLDLIEIDAASNTSVDDVRDLREKINFSPSQGRYKVYIIDEVHMLSTAAFNALLKTLEEPPAHAIFILATTEIHKIPATVLSRCQRHEFRRIAVADIIQQLEKIIKEENLHVDPAALALVARQSTGAMRDAISLLDQLASSGEKVTLTYAHNILGTATNQSVIQVVDNILQRETAKGLETIHTALDSGIDPRQYARQIVEYLRNLLLVKMGNAPALELSAEVRAQIEKHARQIRQEHLLFCLRRFNSTASDTRSNWQPNLPLELAFAESCDFQPGEARVAGPIQPEPERRSTAPSLSPKTVSEPHENPAPKPDERTAHADAASQSRQSEKPKPVDSLSAQVQRTPASQSVKTATPTGSEKTEHKSVSKNWEEIKRQVKKVRPPTEALLNSCSSVMLKENVLFLGFASEVVKSKMDTRENLAIVAPIISQIIGLDITIRCVVVNKNVNSSMDSAQNEDGMVNAALGLGGQIIQKE